MKSFLLSVVATVLSLTSLGAVAELPEFLVPVTVGDNAIARATNDYFVRKNTYFTKRYRIVKVNVGLLQSTEAFRISLFDNDFVSAEVSSLDVREGGLIIRWYGKITEPALSINDLMAPGVKTREAKIAHSAITGLKITAAQISFDAATRTKYQYVFPRFEQFRSANQRNNVDGSSPDTESTALYDVAFTINGILPYQYRLRPLETDSTYHLLIEIDPEKVFSSVHAEDVGNAEQAAKWRQYQDFVRSLGPDPRPTDLHKP